MEHPPRPPMDGEEIDVEAIETVSEYRYTYHVYHARSKGHTTVSLSAVRMGRGGTQPEDSQVMQPRFPEAFRPRSTAGRIADRPAGRERDGERKR